MSPDLEEMLLAETQERSEYEINPWPFVILLSFVLWAAIGLAIHVVTG